MANPSTVSELSQLGKSVEILRTGQQDRAATVDKLMNLVQLGKHHEILQAMGRRQEKIEDKTKDNITLKDEKDYTDVVEDAFDKRKGKLKSDAKKKEVEAKKTKAVENVKLLRKFAGEGYERLLDTEKGILKGQLETFILGNEVLKSYYCSPDGIIISSLLENFLKSPNAKRLVTLSLNHTVSPDGLTEVVPTATGNIDALSIRLDNLLTNSLSEGMSVDVIKVVELAPEQKKAQETQKITETEAAKKKAKDALREIKNRMWLGVFDERYGLTKKGSFARPDKKLIFKDLAILAPGRNADGTINWEGHGCDGLMSEALNKCVESGLLTDQEINLLKEDRGFMLDEGQKIVPDLFVAATVAGIKIPPEQISAIAMTDWGSKGLEGWFSRSDSTKRLLEQARRKGFIKEGPGSLKEFFSKNPALVILMILLALGFLPGTIAGLAVAASGSVALGLGGLIGAPLAGSAAFLGGTARKANRAMS